MTSRLSSLHLTGLTLLVATTQWDEHTGSGTQCKLAFTIHTGEPLPPPVTKYLLKNLQP